MHLNVRQCSSNGLKLRQTVLETEISVRETLLTAKKTRHTGANSTPVCVLPYNKRNINAPSFILRYWQFLKYSPGIGNLFSTPPMIGYPRIFSNILCRTRIKYPPSDTRPALDLYTNHCDKLSRQCLNLQETPFHVNYRSPEISQKLCGLPNLQWSLLDQLPRLPPPIRGRDKRNIHSTPQRTQPRC